MRGVKVGMAMMSGGASGKKDCGFVSRVSHMRGGIKEGMISEYKFGGDGRTEGT